MREMEVAKGGQRIETYDEFKSFFGKIIEPGMEDDYTVEDFVEVRISYSRRCANR